MTKNCNIVKKPLFGNNHNFMTKYDAIIEHKIAVIVNSQLCNKIVCFYVKKLEILHQNVVIIGHNSIVILNCKYHNMEVVKRVF